MKKKKNAILMITSLLLAILYIYPYLMRWSTAAIAGFSDMLFHMSRLYNMMEAVGRRDFFPSVFPLQNYHFGYASPLFYCDFFLIIPAVIGRHFSALTAYKFFVFCCSFFSCFAMEKLVLRITDDIPSSIASGAMYLFANYHITDTYIRSAAGEIAAFVFLPIILSGLYETLEKDNDRAWILTTIGLSGLLLSHNISFILGTVMFIFYCLFYLRRLNKHKIKLLLKGTLAAFLLTAFFSLPMLEQLNSQRFRMSDTGGPGMYMDFTLPLWKYFANKTAFGDVTISAPKQEQPLTNAGWVLTLLPLVGAVLFHKDLRNNHFVLVSLILGYVFLLLPCSLVPWDKSGFLGFMQFPWRILILAVPALTIPASYFFGKIRNTKAKPVSSLLIVFIIIEGIYHLYPIMTYPVVMETSHPYSYYYSDEFVKGTNFYNTTELAVGEYLPDDTPNVFKWGHTIRDISGNDTGISYEQNGTETTIHMSQSKYVNQTIILPLSWYKGYQIYQCNEDGSRIKIPSASSSEDLISFIPDSIGTYLCRYEGTPLRHISCAVSLVTLIVLLLSELIYRKKCSHEA